MEVYSIRRKNNSSAKGSFFPLVSQFLPDEEDETSTAVSKNAAYTGDLISAKFCIFEGVLSNDVVIVSDKNHIKDIYSGGFYGKGSCSYGEPRFDSELHKRLMQVIHGAKPEASNSSLRKNDDLTSTSDEQFEEPQNEELVLLPEEAFFLAFGLGILRVKKRQEREHIQENQEQQQQHLDQHAGVSDGNSVTEVVELSLDELYAHWIETIGNIFALRYAAYHHFRQKGWVVRTGITMGVDFLLYKDGPTFTHSSFMVVVHTDDQDPELAFPALSEDRLDALTRLSAAVQKALLLCYVVRPPEVDLRRADCLRELKICEIITGRWEPAKNVSQ